MELIDEAQQSLAQATRYISYVKENFPEIHDEALLQSHADYCRIGMSHCYVCGWSGDYPVSGCPQCNNSFVE